jgi:hypothetical protein
LQQESGGSLDVFEVADILFCWNAKISICTEGLLQDDVQFLDVHDGSRSQEGIEETNVTEAGMRRSVFNRLGYVGDRHSLVAVLAVPLAVSLGRETLFLVVWSICLERE